MHQWTTGSVSFKSRMPGAFVAGTKHVCTIKPSSKLSSRSVIVSSSESSRVGRPRWSRSAYTVYLRSSSQSTEEVPITPLMIKYLLMFVMEHLVPGFESEKLPRKNALRIPLPFEHP